MKVVYAPRATEDRRRIRQYLRTHSPGGARNVMARLDTAAALLIDQPKLGIASDIPDVRVLFIGQYPYKMFYRVRSEAIEILHIRHTAREPFQDV